MSPRARPRRRIEGEGKFIEAVLRSYLTGDGYIAADDIPAICNAVAALQSQDREDASYKRGYADGQRDADNYIKGCLA